MRTAICFLLFCLMSPAAIAQVLTPPRNAAATGRTAIVRGKVVNSATTNPLHRVKLTLDGDALNAPVAVTGTRGEFEFLDVSPGTLGASERQTDLDFQPYAGRPATVSGRVVRAEGEAVAGAQVALMYSFPGVVMVPGRRSVRSFELHRAGAVGGL